MEFGIFFEELQQRGMYKVYCTNHNYTPQYLENIYQVPNHSFLNYVQAVHAKYIQNLRRCFQVMYVYQNCL